MNKCKNTKMNNLKTATPQTSWFKQMIFGKEEQYETRVEITPKK